MSLVHSGASASIPTEPFIAVIGQSFSSQQDWVNRATRYLTAHPAYNNTEHGDNSSWRGPHFTALCFDQAGNRMRNGGDFMRAEAEKTYPVWWIWPDQINDLLRARTAVESPSVGIGAADEPIPPANGDSQ